MICEEENDSSLCLPDSSRCMAVGSSIILWYWDNRHRTGHVYSSKYLSPARKGQPLPGERLGTNPQACPASFRAWLCGDDCAAVQPGRQRGKGMCKSVRGEAGWDVSALTTGLSLFPKVLLLLTSFLFLVTNWIDFRNSEGSNPKTAFDLFVRTHLV